ncbi:MAG: hypothetical protein MI674_03820, partial [Cytophagales bacterium]|nr:hypothetical protein [Cytophagales bacterium]
KYIFYTIIMTFPINAQASQIKGEMRTIFPQSTEEEKRLFTLLQKAYIGGRYKRGMSLPKRNWHIWLSG